MSPPEARDAGRKGCETIRAHPGLPAQPEKGPGPGWLRPIFPWGNRQTLYSQCAVRPRTPRPARRRTSGGSTRRTSRPPARSPRSRRRLPHEDAERDRGALHEGPVLGRQKPAKRQGSTAAYARLRGPSSDIPSRPDRQPGTCIRLCWPDPSCAHQPGVLGLHERQQWEEFSPLPPAWPKERPDR